MAERNANKMLQIRVPVSSWWFDLQKTPDWKVEDVFSTKVNENWCFWWRSKNKAFYEISLMIVDQSTRMSFQLSGLCSHCTDALILSSPCGPANDLFLLLTRRNKAFYLISVRLGQDILLQAAYVVETLTFYWHPSFTGAMTTWAVCTRPMSDFPRES